MRHIKLTPYTDDRAPSEHEEVWLSPDAIAGMYRRARCTTIFLLGGGVVEVMESPTEIYNMEFNYE